MWKNIKNFVTTKQRELEENKKGICNEVGEIELEYSDYLLNKEDVSLYEKKVKACRDEFKIVYEGTRMINKLDFAINATLLSEVINFYNNDICIYAAKLFAMVEGKGEYHSRVIFNIIDTLSIKVCSCWEYLFQILSKFFMLELNSMNLSKDKLKKIYEKKMIFVETEQGCRIEYADWSEEEREAVKNTLKEKMKVLHVGGKANGFKKSIRQHGYIVSERVNQIAVLYSEKCVERLKTEVRNTITHKKSATFAYSIGEIDVLSPQEGIVCNKKGWIEIEEAKELLYDNVNILKGAIQIAKEIIWLGDRLIHCGNEDKVYEIVELECEQCQHHFNLTSEIYDVEIKYMKNARCPRCHEETKLIGKGTVSEFDYGLVRGQDIRYLDEMINVYDEICE